MDRFDPKDIERLRQLGETVRLPDGEEAVRITAQFRGRPVTRDRAAWTSQLKDWGEALADEVKQFGAHTVEGSLSVSGQTVELVVPIKDLYAAVTKLAKSGTEVRLTRELRIDPNY